MDCFVTSRSTLRKSAPFVTDTDVTWRSKDPIEPTWDHVKQMSYLGDAALVVLNLICSSCNSWHELQVSRPDTFRDPWYDKLTLNLCSDCFSLRGDTRRGTRTTPLSVMLSLSHNLEDTSGELLITSKRRHHPDDDDAFRVRTHRICWTDPATCPVLELRYICNRCGLQQVAADTRNEDPPPEQWVCARCTYAHCSDWGRLSSRLVILSPRCYFCGNGECIRDCLITVQGDERLCKDYFFQCRHCVALTGWITCWKVLRAVAKGEPLQLPHEVLRNVIGVQSGYDERPGPVLPSAFRLVKWKKLPRIQLPLNLDYTRDEAEDHN